MFWTLQQHSKNLRYTVQAKVAVWLLLVTLGETGPLSWIVTVTNLTLDIWNGSVYFMLYITVCLLPLDWSLIVLWCYSSFTGACFALPGMTGPTLHITLAASVAIIIELKTFICICSVLPHENIKMSYGIVVVYVFVDLALFIGLYRKILLCIVYYFLSCVIIDYYIFM